jgi:hypothetical protein
LKEIEIIKNMNIDHEKARQESNLAREVYQLNERLKDRLTEET